MDTTENTETTKAAPRQWAWLMVLASTFYLIPEAIFNAQLVNVAGQGIFSEHELRNVELFGRAISGIGVSLLICDALGHRFVRGFNSGLAVMVAVSLIAWPSVFFGQKILVDELIINPSSPEQRQHAVVSSVIRGALSENAIRIEGVDYDPDHDLNPQEMTFMALFGGMVFADKTLADTIDAKKAGVVRDMVSQRAYADFDSHWAEYQQMYDVMAANYEQYAEGSKRYNSALRSIPERQTDYWETVQTKVKDGWEDYQSAMKAHRARAHTKAERYAGALYDDLDDINDCDTQRCVDTEVSRYRDTVSDMGFPGVDVKHWYQVRDVSTAENVAKTLFGAAVTGGLSLLSQGVDAATGGDGGFKDKSFSYTDDTQHYAQKILELDAYKKQFRQRTGYPRGIDGMWAFRNHPETQKRVRQELAQRGLSMPENWQISDRAAFNQRVEQKVRSEANAKWEKEMEKQGMSLPPNLTWERFQRQPPIQQRIKERMGEYYVDPTFAHWNKKTFKEKVIDTQIEKETQQILSRMEALTPTFKDGGDNEQIGKQMMRAVIVPPISMGLSLLLVVLTLIKLPKKYFGLLRKASAEASESKRHKKVVKGTIMGVTVAAVFVVPLFMWSNDYTSEGSTVHYFLEKTEEHGSLATRYALNWILHAQPVMHPMGQFFEDQTSIFEAFSSNKSYLDQLDRKVLDH